MTCSASAPSEGKQKKLKFKLDNIYVKRSEFNSRIMQNGKLTPIRTLELSLLFLCSYYYVLFRVCCLNFVTILEMYNEDASISYVQF
jgi:hypothetical protein